jgi:DNA-binding GntR family transcriptional regulator
MAVEGKEIVRFPVKIQYADAQIAALLVLAEGDKVVWYRQRERQDGTVLALLDTYAPFWLAEALPELERGERDLLSLMQRVGKQPALCGDGGGCAGAQH